MEEELYDLLEELGFGAIEEDLQPLLDKAKTFDVLSKYKEYILTLVEELADDIEDIELIEKNL